MKRSIFVLDARGERRFEQTDLPLTIGGSDADIAVAGTEADPPLAFIGLAEGSPYIRPAPNFKAAALNGETIDESRWLRDGDLIRIQ